MGRVDDYNRLLGGLAEALAEPERMSAPDLPLAPPLPLRVPNEIDVAAIQRRTVFRNRPSQPCATGSKAIAHHKGLARVLLALLDRNPKIVAETLAD